MNQSETVTWEGKPKCDQSGTEMWERGRNVTNQEAPISSFLKQNSCLKQCKQVPIESACTRMPLENVPLWVNL